MICRTREEEETVWVLSSMSNWHHSMYAMNHKARIP